MLAKEGLNAEWRSWLYLYIIIIYTAFSCSEPVSWSLLKVTDEIASLGKHHKANKGMTNYFITITWCLQGFEGPSDLGHVSS